MKFARAGLWGLALSVLAALPAMAQTFGAPGTGPDGLYIRGEAGWSHMNDMAGYTTTGSSYTSEQYEGYLVGGALGWKFDQLRVELGLDFSNSGIKSIDLNNATSTGVTGEVHNTAGMVNFLWDMRTGTFIVPYIGMGVGVSDVSLSNVGRNGTRLSNSSDLVFAYQPMVGVNFHLTNQLALGLQYRYFATVDPSFNYAPGGKLGLKNESHNVLAGLTWYFGVPTAPPPPAPGPVVYQPPAPAPVPPPPPPPPAPQVFIVFFNFNQATITPEGRMVVQQAAMAFQQNGGTRIQLTGYTDLTGTQRYDLDLSRRRAIAVRDSLVQLGVPANEIEANWRGKDNPRVPTNAREPQNRRVEIDIP